MRCTQKKESPLPARLKQKGGFHRKWCVDRHTGRRLFGYADAIEDEGELEGGVLDAIVAPGGAAVAGIHVHVENEDVVVRLHGAELGDVLEGLVEEYLGVV